MISLVRGKLTRTDLYWLTWRWFNCLWSFYSRLLLLPFYSPPSLSLSYLFLSVWHLQKINKFFFFFNNNNNDKLYVHLCRAFDRSYVRGFFNFHFSRLFVWHKVEYTKKKRKRLPVRSFVRVRSFAFVFHTQDFPVSILHFLLCHHLHLKRFHHRKGFPSSEPKKKKEMSFCCSRG